MQKNEKISLQHLFSGLSTILKPQTPDALLKALSELQVNEECAIMTLRRCQINAQGIPVLELQAVWSQGDVAVWQEAVDIDDELLAKVWILSAGPPLFIEDIQEFALFTHASREFYIEQGVVSLYRILIKREGECTAMLTVMWTSPRTFSAEYRAIIELISWILLPVIENIYAREQNKQLIHTIAQLEQNILEAENRIHALAHDLKQPLSAIMTTASLLYHYVDRLSKEQIASKLERILETSEGMSDWISSILLLAQVRSNQEIELMNVQMSKILSEIVNWMQEFITDTSAQINYSAVAEDIEIRGRPIWIQHIWMNLISNACKYGGQSPIITISAEDLQHMVRFTVSDNGPGIPQEKLHLVFEPFSRFSPEKSGSGIGLTTVKVLVEKMGGNIGVESNPAGTTFWFTLRKSS